jgi:hypothetical protein
VNGAALEAADVVEEQDDPPGSRRNVLDRAPRLAAIVFGVLEAIALAFFLYVGREQWFFHDEWKVLVTPDGIGLNHALEPFNGHWITLPRVVYRLWFSVFGLNSYVPYQLVAILLQLAAAALLRVAMRRSGVSPWIATTAAGVFLFFGSGDQDIIRAFQMTFTGALVLGLVHLLLADHDGGIRRADWIGLIAGLGALMCSGVGVTMLVVTGVAVWLRRGWKLALFHTVPLAAIFGVWYVSFAEGSVPVSGASLRGKLAFVFHALTDAFHALGSSGVVAVLLGALLAVGLVLAARGRSVAQVREQMSLPIALLVGAGVFAGLTAWSRTGVAAGTTTGRYLHIIAALSVTALAVAADAVVRRKAVLAPFVVLLLVAGLPHNVEISWNQDVDGRGQRPDQALFTAFPNVDEVRDAPDWVRPDPQSAPQVTLGWLRQVVAQGRLPAQQDIPADVVEGVVFRASLQLGAGPPVPAGCPALRSRQVVHFEQGDRLPFTGAIQLRLSGVRGTDFNRVEFDGTTNSVVLALRGPVDAMVIPDAGGPSPRVCPVQHTG